MTRRRETELWVMVPIQLVFAWQVLKMAVIATPFIVVLYFLNRWGCL